jgi:hypothetical protein
MTEETNQSCKQVTAAQRIRNTQEIQSKHKETVPTSQEKGRKRGWTRAEEKEERK